jgi:hypothetical protein
MKKSLAAAMLVAFVFAGNVAAAPQSDPMVAPSHVQLQRMLTDYRLADIMRGYFSNNRAMFQSLPMGDIFNQIGVIQNDEMARVLAPALSDCATEEDSRRMADFFETPSGQLMINYIVETSQNPLDPVTKPQLDPLALKVFQANGGVAAVQKFAACMKAPDGQRRLMIALIHYLTRPEANPGT